MQIGSLSECTGDCAPGVPAWLGWSAETSGKSFMLALVAVFLACFYDFSRYLTRGERHRHDYGRRSKTESRHFEIHPWLVDWRADAQGMIERETAESFDLSNKITIEVATASFKTVRG